MARKRTSGRQSESGTFEAKSSRGQFAAVKKRSINFHEKMDRVFRQIPAHGKHETDLSRAILEDRDVMISGALI
jgi:hypothetical protein